MSRCPKTASSILHSDATAAYKHISSLDTPIQLTQSLSCHTTHSSTFFRSFFQSTQLILRIYLGDMPSRFTLLRWLVVVALGGSCVLAQDSESKPPSSYEDLKSGAKKKASGTTFTYTPGTELPGFPEKVYGVRLASWCVHRYRGFARAGTNGDCMQARQ
jgi:hypothetical protein